ncbi:L-threonine aldolase [Mucilaginibacter gracilis]|uniref:L-threonine aldolase n=1 Tax=Mucilaginibacter gracilis TaxID=423350 RepID=A0A495J039_9SPHI|nr:aminotransferase class I/II-fold pyridoxal phosphate-dependent enzyme [Mucilaginibacter gracilis]RKR82133.1 L-threonine aldolase [Mucilaginibacter gracilis]
MIKRRNFLKLSGAGLLPVMASTFRAFAQVGNTIPQKPGLAISFVADGPEYTPEAYVKKLQELLDKRGIKPDVYGKGGAVTELEGKLAQLTGKEAAIYVPTGTMANQLALSLLSGTNTKIYLPDNSHIFRDEADAAQSVYGKRLIPLAKEAPYFTLQQLQEGIAYDNEHEVFKSGLGAIAIENPVRRADGRHIPFEELRKISAFCRQNKYPLHLDGARLFLAAAASGVSIADYAQLFDTVYLSLYKYIGAGGGAVLAGEKSLIDKMGHLIKIHGGTIYSNWTNAAMALYHLEGLPERLKKTLTKAQELISAMNKVNSLQATELENGTNIFYLTPDNTIDGKRFSGLLREQQILIRNPDAQGLIRLQVNETLLDTDINQLIHLLRDTLAASAKR